MDQPQKRLAGQMNWTGSVVRRGLVGWSNEDVTLVCHPKLDNKSPSDTAWHDNAGSKT